MKFNSAKQPVWRKKSKTVKLQTTSTGYHHINIPKESVRRLQWPENAILEVEEMEGSLVLTNIRSKRYE